MEMTENTNKEPSFITNSETKSGNKGNHEDRITCKMLESAEVAINISVHLKKPLIDRRTSEFRNIYQRMISINDDPDLQQLIVPKCGLTCLDLKDLARGVKVSHLEKLCPYLEKHIGKHSENTDQRGLRGWKKSSKKSVTRRELRKLVKTYDENGDGILSREEFCKFLSELDDRVQEKCNDPDAVMKTWKELTHAGVYSCWPPPLVIPFAILLQVIVFLYHHYYYAYNFATTHSAPMCSKLALHPERRWQEPWRYLTYGLVHKDYSHLLKNIAGLAMAGMILEYYHKSWRVFLVYAAGVVVGGIGRINPVARKTPLTPLVGSSGAVYALFGANIAHIIINWKEDAVIFRRFAHGQDLKPLSKKYAKCGRTIRAAVLGFWFTSELCYAVYEKIIKCKAWDTESDMQDELNDFDQCSHENDSDSRWWCKTETSYSAHIFGFLAGLFFGICILQTPNVTKTKRILRFISMFIFLIIFGSGLYQNILESLEHGKFSAKCTTLDYEKMCQAKCYCNINDNKLISANETFYQNCQMYNICVTCGDNPTIKDGFCSYLQ